MAEYTKTIKNRANLWVEAKVFRNGTCCEQKNYIGFVDTTGSLERRFKKAHKWADEVIRILREQECL